MRTLWVVLALVVACKDNKRPEPGHRSGDPAGKRAGLAEVGPHPDYPTAAAAGTDKLFFLEEPDRGPPAPTTFSLPATLAWTDAPFCEEDALGVACGTGEVGAAHWRIARATGLTVAQRIVGGMHVQETFAWVRDGDGARTQRVHLDALGHVDEAYLWNQPDRFTGRARSGSNVLRGCGMIGIDEDAQHRIAARRCLQWLADGMRDTSGVAVRRYAYDARGFVSEEQRFGLDGKAVDDTTGVHRVAYTRDAAGRATLARYFSAAGARTRNTDGCAGEAYAYDASGAMARATCVGPDDAPAPNADGVTMTAYGYDFAGCPTSERYLDVRGGEVVDHLGLTGRVTLADAHCVPVEQKCLGARGRAAPCGPGQPARRTFALDDRGRVVTAKHWNADGEPTGDESFGAFELRRGYDAAGNPTSLDCFDGTGDAVECGGTGFHGWRMTYDSAGRAQVQSFVDAAGRPAKNVGISQRRFRYDNYDHEVEAANLDGDGQPFEANGAAVRKNLWDATHRLFAVQLFDARGKPARYDGCFTGATCPKGPWQAVRINRRANGVATTNQFFDADGQLIDTVDCTERPCFDEE